jgi:uncharacterized damage-inducible protein DinB
MKNDDADLNEIKDYRVVTPQEMLEHWQGHRRLTRRVIDAFPEDKLFTYSIGGMRPFAAMAMEFIGMAEPGIIGIATGKWKRTAELPHHTRIAEPKTKEALLERWDYVTEHINKLWKEIPPQRFNEKDIAFGQWEGTFIPLYNIG